MSGQEDVDETTQQQKEKAKKKVKNVFTYMESTCKIYICISCPV